MVSRVAKGWLVVVPADRGRLWYVHLLHNAPDARTPVILGHGTRAECKRIADQYLLAYSPDKQ